MTDFFKELWTWQPMLVMAFAFLYLIFNEVEDESIKSNWTHHQKFLNTNKSANNKWKLDDQGNKIPYTRKQWFYFTFYPHYQERFIYSSTILVFLTDGEHLFQFIKNMMILGASLIISIYAGIACFIGLKLGSLVKEKINWLA